jgi:putative hydrolase of the HAD superfamily
VSSLPATLFVDADNTLWDTDAVFARAQLQLLYEVASALNEAISVDDPLAFVRSVDQALAERHHAGLRYPPLLLIRAVELALSGAPTDRAARSAWKGQPSYRLSADAAALIEQRFFAAVARSPDLRPGVAEGLDRLRAAGCLLLVISEGAKLRVERTIERLGLAGLFDRVIEAPKAPELYQRVVSLTGARDRTFMVGDQLDRDIVPARAAGITTIYFPGGFQPRWSPAIETARPDHVVASFAEVADIILGARQPLQLRAIA